MDNPLVVLDGRGYLHGVVVVEDRQTVSPEIKSRWEKRLMTPGMDSLRVRSVESFEPGSEAAGWADLVIPIAPNFSSETKP